ncbi:TPA: helix-turn-helix domain-containing protein, partial [Streptococcus agalactiae]
LKGMGQFVKYQLDEGEHPYCKNCMKKLHHAVQGRPKKFCSNRCRAIWWRNHQSQHDKTKTAYDELTCQNCGESFLSYANPKRKFCGHPCYVEYRFRKGVRNDNATNHGD